MSLKVAYWLSDVSVAGRGNMLIVPGSHERNTLPRPDRPERGFDPPAGAEPVLASPGDALVFDRRLWHSRSDNLSEHTRRVVFLAYTFRWVRPRDELGIDPSSERFRGLSPVRRQLLGEPAGRHHQWGLQPDAVPLQPARSLAAESALELAAARRTPPTTRAGRDSRREVLVARPRLVASSPELRTVGVRLFHRDAPRCLMKWLFSPVEGIPGAGVANGPLGRP